MVRTGVPSKVSTAAPLLSTAARSYTPPIGLKPAGAVPWLTLTVTLLATVPGANATVAEPSPLETTPPSAGVTVPGAGGPRAWQSVGADEVGESEAPAVLESLGGGGVAGLVGAGAGSSQPPEALEDATASTEALPEELEIVLPSAEPA